MNTTEERLKAKLDALKSSIEDIRDGFEATSVLQQIVDRIRALTGAAYAALGAVRGADAPLDPWIYSQAVDGWTELPLPPVRPRGLLGFVMRSSGPVRVALPSGDESFEGLCPDHPRIKNLLGMPLRHQGQLSAILILVNKMGGSDFDEEDQDTALLLGELAALVIERDRVYDRMAEELAERRHIEEALRESEQRFRFIFEGACQFIALLSPEGIVLENNKTAASFCGVTPLASIGRAFWELVGWKPEDQARVRALVAAASSGKLVRDDMEVLGADGLSIIIDFSIKPATDERGTVVMLIAEGHDVSARKAVEEEREQLLAEVESERLKLWTVFHNVPIPLWIIEQDGFERAEANAHARALFGEVSQQSHFLGQLCRSNGSPLSLEELPSSRALRGETIMSERLLLRLCDGSLRPFLVAAAPFRDQEGKIKGAVVAGEDISALEEREKKHG